MRIDPITIKNLEKRIRGLRNRLLLRFDFFASVAMMPMIPSSIVDVAATDGKKMIYNPSFFLQASDSFISCVLLHEILHCILMHPFRRKNRIVEIWQYAVDFAVNAIIVQYCHGITMPEDALYSKEFHGMSAEEIYDLLIQNMQHRKPPQGDSLGKNDLRDYGTLGDDGRGHGKSEADNPYEESKYKNKIEKVIQESKKGGGKKAGTEQSMMKEILDQIHDDQKPWYTKLLDEFFQKIRDEYTWSKPNRRYVQHGVFLPAIEKKIIQKISFAIDTSGSMNKDQLQVAMKHIMDILEIVSVQTVDLIQCDNRIHKFQQLDQSEFSTINAHDIKGRGGTDFNPVFEYYNTHGEEPDVLLYFTDLEGPCTVPQPNFPVFWITDNPSQECAFGKRIMI